MLIRMKSPHECDTRKCSSYMLNMFKSRYYGGISGTGSTLPPDRTRGGGYLQGSSYDRSATTGLLNRLTQNQLRYVRHVSWGSPGRLVGSVMRVLYTEIPVRVWLGCGISGFRGEDGLVRASGERGVWSSLVLYRLWLHILVCCNEVRSFHYKWCSQRGCLFTCWIYDIILITRTVTVPVYQVNILPMPCIDPTWTLNVYPSFPVTMPSFSALFRRHVSS